MNEKPVSELPHVVIVGGGFGGLNTAKSLKRADVRITLIDRRNFHLFQPLLYQVATGGLSPANISAPLRSVLRRQRNLRVVLGTVLGFDPERRIVQLDDGEIGYDWLLGSRQNVGISLGIGATRLFGGTDALDGLSATIPTLRLLNIGIAF